MKEVVNSILIEREAVTFFVPSQVGDNLSFRVDLS